MQIKKFFPLKTSVSTNSKFFATFGLVSILRMPLDVCFLEESTHVLGNQIGFV